MDETQSPEIAVQEPAETVGTAAPCGVPAAKANPIVRKIIGLFDKEKRTKTLIILACAVVVIGALIGFLVYRSPSAVAKRFVLAMRQGDLATEYRCYAYDQKKVTLSGYDDDEDAFFLKMSDTYDEDIDSWRSYFKARRANEEESMWDHYGEYKISAEVTREKNLRTWPKSTSELLKNLEKKYGFDRDTISGAAKEMTVKVKIVGDKKTMRYTYTVCLVKIHGSWSVLDYDREWD